MSRLLNVASAAAVVLTASAMLLLTEPGRANDLAVQELAVASVAPVVLPPSIVRGVPFPPVAVPPVTTPEIIDRDSPPAVAPSAEAARAESLAALVAATAMPAEIDDEMRCLAGTIYFESRSESLIGQLAVAHVVLNRAESGRFRPTLCGVVYQPSQFSFVRSGRMPAINTAGHQWRNAVAIALIARDDSWKNKAPGALYFHATRVSPGWSRPRVAQIDNHIFYR